MHKNDSIWMIYNDNIKYILVLNFIHILLSYIIKYFYVLKYDLHKYLYGQNKEEKILIFIECIICCIILPIREELMFRGLFNDNLSHIISNKNIVYLISSLVFGLVHLLNIKYYIDTSRTNLLVNFITYFTYVQVLCTCILGFRLSQCNNIIVAILLHASYNLIGFIVKHVEILLYHAKT